jgi:tetratricopeptide (TPR) repeat protein
LRIVLGSALGLVPVVGLAQGDRGGSRPQADASASTASKYAEACSQGNARYASRDYQGAIALYRSAIELDPHNALGHYLIGEAHLAAGNIGDAEAAWNQASVESSDKEPDLRARILFVIADLKERQWKWSDAVAAWQVYIDWATRFPKAAVFPDSGRSRQQVIDHMLKQDKAYEVVRRHIALAKDGGVFTDLSKSPPSATK